MNLVSSRVLERLVGFESELAWASGHGPLPDGKARPEWFRKLMLRLAETSALDWVFRLQAKAAISPRDLGELTGCFEAFAAALAQPSEASLKEEAETPILKTFREAMLKVSSPRLEQLSAWLPKLPVAKTGEPAQQIASFYSGAASGAQKVETATTTTTEDLLYWMWLFWPEVSTAKSREELHRWLTEMRFVSCSFKLVEKICREIGFRSRPKQRSQPTQRQKRVGRRSR